MKRSVMRDGVVLAMVMLGLAAGCASTKVVSTWRDPSFKGPIDFKRTLVVAIDDDRYRRNSTEDVLVERIGPGRAVAAHDVLTEQERTPAQLAAKLPKTDIDGVVTLAIAGASARTSRDMPAGSTEPFYEYYDRSSAFLQSGGSAQSTMVYRLETKIFSVNEGRLIWSALTDTVDPDDSRTAVRDIARAVGDELRKQKLIR